MIRSIATSGARLRAAATIGALALLVFSTMGVLVLGVTTSALALLDMPVAVWGTADAIAALALFAACVKLAIHAWPIALGEEMGGRGSDATPG
ncbi:MAG: hypothetical protein RID91_12305 [Azospirillaceae bacterium]